MNGSGGSTSNGPGEPPLAVDLDGTLISTDSLVEGIVQVLKRNPLSLFLFPVWLVRGKAAFKDEIAGRVELDAIFELTWYTRHVDAIFERLGALARKEEPIHA